MKLLIGVVAIFVSSFSYAQLDVDTSGIDLDYSYEALPSEYIPIQQNNRWYLFDIIEQQLDSTRSFDRLVLNDRIVEYYIFEQDNRIGALDIYGDTLLPFEYDSIVAIPYGVAGKNGNYWDFKTRYWDSPIQTVRHEIDSFYCLNDVTYTYRDGKMGVFLFTEQLLAPQYDRVQAMNQTPEFVRQYDVFLVSEGANFRFFDFDGNDLLGGATSKYQILDHGFLKYWDGHWKYYNFTTEEHLNFGGNPMVFYNPSSYKVYNQNRTKGVYYEKGSAIGSGFDDYFPIGKDFLAVRQNGKIGVIGKNGRLVVAPKYDKVECLNYESAYFKYFVGDACGLLSESGEELSKAMYANIIETKSRDRFIVIDNQKTGIIDHNGKEICPVEYTYIKAHQDCFTIQKGMQIGLMNWDGKVILQPNYAAYEIFWFRDVANESYQTFVFKDASGKFILANKSNRLTDRSFDEFNYGNNTYKLYRSAEIEVVVLNEKGEIDDRMNYANVGSLVIENDFEREMNGADGWGVSYLEENQLTGKFGLRWFSKQGIAVETSYDYVQRGRLSSYFGEREVAAQSVELFPGVSVRLNRVYDQLYMNSGRVINTDLVAAESVLHWSSALSTWEALICSSNLNLRVELEEQISPISSRDSKTKANYSEHLFSQDLKLLTLNAQPELCALEDAEVSLLEYYQYFNVLGGMELTEEASKAILNPQLGVRFIGGKKRVYEIGLRPWNMNFVSFRPHKDVQSIRFLAENDLMVIKELDDEDNLSVKEYTWPKEEKPLTTLDCFEFRDEQATQGRFYEAFKKVDQNALVHLDFPDFLFYPIDSIPLKYSAGRLISGEVGEVQLLDPAGKVYIDRAKEIDYLGNDLFRVKFDSLWHVVDRNNGSWNQDSFDLVITHANGILQLFQGEQSFLYKLNGELLAAGDRGLKWVTEEKYRVSNAPEVWLDASTGMKHTIDSESEYVGQNFFLKKSPTGTYQCTRFGQEEVLEFETDSKPRLVGRFLTYELKKFRYLIAQNGEETKWKNASLPQKKGACFTMEGKKKVLVFNENGQWIADAPSDAQFSPANGGVLVSTSDTNYVILQDGTAIAWSAFKEAQHKSQEEVHSITVAYENGKAGVKQDGTFIISPEYENLSRLEGSTYSTQISNGWRIYNDDLKEFISIPYDDVYQLPNYGWMFFTNGRYHHYDFEGNAFK